MAGTKKTKMGDLRQVMAASSQGKMEAGKIDVPFWDPNSFWEYALSRRGAVIVRHLFFLGGVPPVRAQGSERKLLPA